MEFSSATYGELQWENFKSLKFEETGFKSKYSSNTLGQTVVSGVEAHQQHNTNQMFKILSGILTYELNWFLFSQVKVNIVKNWDDVNKVM